MMQARMTMNMMTKGGWNTGWQQKETSKGY